MRLVGADVTDDRVAMVNSDSASERLNSFGQPFFVQFRQFATHAKRSAGRRFRIGIEAVTAHVSPDRHDRVSDKLIERPAVIENIRHHRAQIAIQLRDQRDGIGFFRQTGEPNQIRKQNRDRLARTQHRTVKTARIIENFFDDIFRNVTLERPASAHFLDSFQRVFEP